MASYDVELLNAAVQLLARGAGQKGKLPSARIRRSISTSYYALFHFLLEEAGGRLVGSSNGLLRRRRIMARSLSHSGIRTAFGRIRGKAIHASVADFLAPPGSIANGAAPRFARTIAMVFDDAHTRRQEADYNLNKQYSEADARILARRVVRAIELWRSARTASDRDFKHALCMLMLLGGRLRQDV